MIIIIIIIIMKHFLHGEGSTFSIEAILSEGLVIIITTEIARYPFKPGEIGNNVDECLVKGL